MPSPFFCIPHLEKFNNWNVSHIQVGNDIFISILINNKDQDDPHENEKKAFADGRERTAHGMAARIIRDCVVSSYLPSSCRYEDM